MLSSCQCRVNGKKHSKARAVMVSVQSRFRHDTSFTPERGILLLYPMTVVFQEYMDSKWRVNEVMKSVI